MNRKRLLALLYQDIRFELRHGMYTVYAVLSVIYIFLLRSLPETIQSRIAVILLFSDPAVLGFFFIGGMVLLERKQRTLSALACTPLQAGEYLAAKSISLALLSLAACSIIVLAGLKTPISWGYLIIGVLLSSCWVTLVSIPFSLTADSLNDYFITAGGALLLLCLPLFDLIFSLGWKAAYLFPTHASILLITGAFRPISPGDTIYGIIYLAGASVLTWRWAAARLSARVLGGGDHED